MSESAHKTNFIRHIIDADIAAGKNQGNVITRFPPEPNGYLHIGHAKAICINFGMAKSYQSVCHLRFDDTNPCNESDEYKRAIQADIQWLGFDWGQHLYATSDYFDAIYDCAVTLIKAGKAYVCGLSPEQVREYRGTLTEAGKPSPDRDRSIDDNLELFERMRAGEFSDGQYSLRAKIDMSSGNMNMRDPALYRIRHVEHHSTGNQWCIYPMYDFSHPISDALEGITHSLCSLEFQDHRPLYDWVIEHCELKNQPQQIEFSRLNLNYTITSKRKLKHLVETNQVSGWDDPRMPTLRGQRRRGVPPEAIRELCDQVGVSKQNSIIDMSLLEQCSRNYLDSHAPRRMAVLDPIKVIIDSYPAGQVEMLNVSNHPKNPDFGRRDIPFSQTLYIERDDFMLEPVKGFHRLAPGKSVRLLNAYVIECQEVIQDDNGQVTEIHCTHLPETLGGKKPEDGRKVKGFIHWLSAPHAKDADVRLYDRLFVEENPAALEDYTQALNPNALVQMQQAKIEPSLTEAEPEQRFQFNRLGYFCADRVEHAAENPVFNRIVTLRDGWTKK